MDGRDLLVPPAVLEVVPIENTANLSLVATPVLVRPTLSEHLFKRGSFVVHAVRLDMVKRAASNLHEACVSSNI
jgi:hypothetical protein